LKKGYAGGEQGPSHSTSWWRNKKAAGEERERNFLEGRTQLHRERMSDIIRAKECLCGDNRYENLPKKGNREGETICFTIGERREETTTAGPSSLPMQGSREKRLNPSIPKHWYLDIHGQGRFGVQM